MSVILELALFVIFTAIFAIYLEYKCCLFDKILKVINHILNPDVEIRFLATCTSNVSFTNLKPILISISQSKYNHVKISKNSNSALQILLDNSHCIRFQTISEKEVYFQTYKMKVSMNTAATITENMLHILDKIMEDLTSKNYECSIDNYTVDLYLPFEKLIFRKLSSKISNAHAFKIVTYNERYSNQVLVFGNEVRINAQKKDILMKLMKLFT